LLHATSALNQALEQSKNSNASLVQALGLAALAKGLKPGEAGLLFEPAARILTKALEEEMDPRTRAELSKGLAAVAVHMEPSEATRQSRRAADALTQLLRETWTARTESSDMPLAQADVQLELAQELAALVARLELVARSGLDGDADEKERKPMSARLAIADVSGMLSEAARVLTRIMANSSASDIRQDSAKELAVIASRMDGREIDSPLNQAAQVLTRALENEKDAETVHILAEALGAIAPRLDTSERARLLGQAVQDISRALRKAPDANTVQQLGAALSTVATRLEAGEAVQDLGIVTTGLILTLSNTNNPFERLGATKGLHIIVARLPAKEAVFLSQQIALVLVKNLEDAGSWLPWTAGELLNFERQLRPAEATNLCIRAIKKMRIEAEQTAGWQRCNLELGVAILIQGLDPVLARRYSKEMAFRLCSGRDINYSQELEDESAFDRTRAFDTMLTDITQQQEKHRAVTVATAIGLARGQSFAALPAFLHASNPDSCYLSTQDLVDLLKMPTCFGKARQVVLKHLGYRYHRTFANHWDFVRYAKEQRLDLDFTTPPKRPARP
jgi:hypothetical protein